MVRLRPLSGRSPKSPAPTGFAPKTTLPMGTAAVGAGVTFLSILIRGAFCFQAFAIKKPYLNLRLSEYMVKLIVRFVY